MAREPVFPFFVGSGRSGTTLVRAMFDSHPDMAIPDESNFVPRFGKARERYEEAWGFATAAFLRDLFRERWFRQSGLSQEAVREAFDANPPANVPSAIREVFALYARQRGKSLYGDKTPSYVLHLPLLADLFPEARFVHVLRDGRDVAMSLLDVGFGPRTMTEAAIHWRERVGKGLAEGRPLGPGRYREVRYEDVLNDPAGTIEPLCYFVGVEFDPAMLRYFERADSIVSANVYKYRSVRLPPTKRLRDWRTQLPSRDLALFEALAGEVLDEAGYERSLNGSSSLLARADAHARALAVAMRHIPRDVRRSLARKKVDGAAGGSGPRMISQPGQGRDHVVSFLRAREAAEDPRVVSFRTDVMGSQLLRLDQVEGWVARQACNENRSEPPTILEFLGAYGQPIRRPLPAGGPLEELRSLSLELVARYGWEPSQASTFVLTDLAPLSDPIRASIAGGWPSSATTRLVLEVDPPASPRAVMKRYKALRRQLILGRFHNTDRKRLDLVVFVERRPDESWEELMASWNRAHARWRYRRLVEFKRDAQLTRHRLLEPPWW
jgi:hypothetical protein